MSYMALYRKYRPDEFSDVKGQEHVVTTLKNQVKHERIGHAYLFCGTRGTGKTTIARLLAKSVNCENPVDGGPCNQCASCMAIANGTATNIVEVDAASNNGVENIREINNTVQYTPAMGKYIVYIIDEAHMLTASSWNALLKTIEEPPSYVIFILATTESFSIPVTIKSRCQRYDFKRISLETIADRLEEVLKSEGVEADRQAVMYVARAGDGSMRDALSILDKCVSYNLGERLTFERVLNTIGAVDIDIYVRFAEAIKADDMIKVTDFIDEIVHDGRDLGQFVNDFIQFIRNMLFIKMAPATADNMDLTKEDVEIVKKLAEGFSEEILIRYLNILQETGVKLKTSTMKKVTLELGIIRLCRPETDTDYSSVIERVEKLEKNVDDIKKTGVKVSAAVPVAGGEDPLDSVVSASPEERGRDIVKKMKINYPEASEEDIKQLISDWNEKIVPLISGHFAEKTLGGKVAAGSSLSEILVWVKADVTLTDKHMLENNTKPYLEGLIEDIINKKVTVKFVYDGKGSNSRDKEHINDFDFSGIGAGMLNIVE